MAKEELIQKLRLFHVSVQNYRRLLLESRDSVLPEITKNQNLITVQRSQLNKQYGALEKYVKKLGKNPKMSDGVWKVLYPVYENAFSADTLLRVGPSLDAVLQDLDYIFGKLEVMSDDEFKFIFSNQKSPQAIINTLGTAIRDIKNPHKQYWKFIFSKIWNWIKENKLISGIIIVIIGGLILAIIRRQLGY